MSRHGYVEGDDYDDDSYFAMVRHMGTLTRTIRGKRGQAMLRRLAAALDAMPDKRLVAKSLVDEDGGVCALGALGVSEGKDLSAIDPEDFNRVAAVFGISATLAREIAWHNDEVVTPPRPKVQGGYYAYADGRKGLQHKPWLQPPEGAMLIERVEVPPTPEEVITSERARWQHMRSWVERNLIDQEEGS